MMFCDLRKTSKVVNIDANSKLILQNNFLLLKVNFQNNSQNERFSEFRSFYALKLQKKKNSNKKVWANNSVP